MTRQDLNGKLYTEVESVLGEELNKYIEKVNSREVTLCNGLEVVIGRTHSKEFKKEFFKWRMWLGN